MIMKVIFASLLWGTIFGSHNTLAGFTYQSMLAYYVIHSFLTKLDKSDQISWTVSEGIRNGNFSKYMIIPTKADYYFFAMDIGMMVPHFVSGTILMFGLLMILGIADALIIDVELVLSAVIMAFLGLLFMAQLNYFIGLLAFKYNDVSTFLMIKKNFLSLINGSIIPLALFPKIVTSILSWLPFYYVSYFPSMLLLGKGRTDIFQGMFTLIVWNIIMKVLSVVTYEKYRVKYDGFGL
jgi:ABC-2 type transport system permease protein